MRNIRPDRLEAATFFLLFVLALALLWTPPMVGLADNGDFKRLLRWGGLDYRPIEAGGDFESGDRYVRWIESEFRFVRHPLLALPAWTGFPSSEAIFIKAAALLAPIWPGGGRFDLRLLGLVHALAFAAASVILLRGWRAVSCSPFVLIPALIFVFCDIGYLVYFHSFYSEAASLIFLLAFVGAGFLVTTGDPSSGPISRRRLALFLASAFLLITAKSQNLVLALPLLIVVGRLCFEIRHDHRSRRLLLAGTGIILIVAAGILFVTPRAMKNANLYNSVFNGLLKWTPSPEAALAGLGIEPELASLLGSNYFQTPAEVEGEEMKRRFFARTGPVRVVGHYLRHPRDFGRAMQVTAGAAFTLQPPPYGNFEKISGRAPREKARRWNLWSRFKDRALPHSLRLTIAHAALMLFAIGWVRRREGKKLGEFYFALWIMMGLSFAAPVLGDGENDLEKHLFLYQVFFDLSLVIAAGYAVRSIERRLDARRRS